jgi:hypothetical protein
MTGLFAEKRRRRRRKYFVLENWAAYWLFYFSSSG